MADFNEWIAAYADDSERIAEGHDILIGHTTKLVAALSDESSRETVAGIVENLAADMKEHFQGEEELMEKNKYPNFDAHKKEHESLLEQITDIGAQLDVGPEFNTVPIALFLRDRLMTHLVEEDDKYSQHMTEIATKLALL